MLELILMFGLVVFIFWMEISIPAKESICKLHSWSKDISTNQLVCMECNKRLP